MYAELFDEHAADQSVIKSLKGEIKRLQGVTRMSKVIKSSDGKYYVVHDYEQISTEQAQELLTTLKEDVAVLEDVLANAPAAGADGSASAAPATPADPTNPAPAAPADPTPAPVAPLVNPADAGGVPTAPPPPVDPNVPMPPVPSPAAPTDPNAGTATVSAPNIQ